MYGTVVRGALPSRPGSIALYYLFRSHRADRLRARSTNLAAGVRLYDAITVRLLEVLRNREENVT